MFVSPPPSFFRTRIYRIDADASLGGRYCLPDSSSLHGYKSRDCVPGYSRLRSVLSSRQHVTIYKFRWIRIIRVRFTSLFFFEHGFIGLTRMLRSVGGTVFQTAVLSMVINPETASRVTLALLGTGFQPALNSMFVVGNKFCLEDNTERSESNPWRSLGITNNEGRAVWKTVPSLIKSVESAFYVKFLIFFLF